MLIKLLLQVVYNRLRSSNRRCPRYKETTILFRGLFCYPTRCQYFCFMAGAWIGGFQFIVRQFLLNGAFAHLLYQESTINTVYYTTILIFLIRHQ